MAYTPWGQSQYQTTLAPGITSYGCAGHGGIHLDEERQAQLPDWARVPNFLRTLQWWEEDRDWVVPFLAFIDDIQAYVKANPESGAAKHHNANYERALLFAERYYPTVYAGYMAGQALKPQ